MREHRDRRIATFVIGMAVAGVMAAGPALATHGPPNDPLYPETAQPFDLGQWGLRQVGAEEAWHNSTGSGAVIAVVDNGVAFDHPDLAANMLPGNTFVDCGDEGCGDGSWQDSDDPLAAPYHGTHVAGIAAAVTDNGRGVAGVAPEAAILPVNVFDGAGASTEDVAHGVRWASDHGADVINLSLGTLPGVGHALHVLGAEEDLEAAFAYARSKGVVIVAAAGNEAFPLCDYPAFSAEVLCVGATDSFELPAEYSNFPVKPDQLAVRAPGGGSADFQTTCGGGIVSTVPAGKGQDFCGYPEASSDPAAPEYGELIGTSMAAPHVAGVAALLAAQGCGREQILELVRTTARHPITGQRGTFSPDYGYGIVDAGAATTAAIGACGQVGGNQAPTAVRDSASTASSESVTVAVLANDSDPDGDSLNVTAVSQPRCGTVTMNADDTVTYEPSEDFKGKCSFDYTVSDGRGGEDAASVTVRVGKQGRGRPDSS